MRGSDRNKDGVGMTCMSTTKKSGLTRVEDSYPENRRETHSVQICRHTNGHSSFKESLFYLFIYKNTESLFRRKSLNNHP